VRIFFLIDFAIGTPLPTAGILAGSSTDLPTARNMPPPAALALGSARC
jgi:hypothetical protein